MMKIIELKHLDAIKGNFGITDGKEYGAAAMMLQEKQPIRQLHDQIVKAKELLEGAYRHLTEQEMWQREFVNLEAHEL
jgi:hypothetical protein